MDGMPPKVYAVKHKDIQTRMASRSGGIFTALSDEVFRRGGTVYGCILNERFEAIHVRATHAEERDKMRGSKYTQSRIGDMFRAVKGDLGSGKAVLFSGTSCQIAGLQSFLQRKYENLCCVDLVCHGVPSPLIWAEYVGWQEEKNNGQCVQVEFRNKKKYGWAAHIETVYLKKDGQITEVDSDIFKTLFFQHHILRPSCFKCPYKSITHPGDITIADYWGIQRAAPGFDDNKGVSLVLVNTETGDRYFDAIQCQIDWVACRIEDSMQASLQYPYQEPEGREQFWADYYGKGFAYIVKRYYGNHLKNQLGKLKKRWRKKSDGLIRRIKKITHSGSFSKRR